MSMEIIQVVSELAPTLMKYSEIEPEFIKIEVSKKKYGDKDHKTLIKINSDRPEVGEALSELLLMMAKLSEANSKTKVEVKLIE